MEALSNDDYFITFVIDENYDYYLNPIINNTKYNKTKYQIIYTPSEQSLDLDKFRTNNIQVHDGMIKLASISFISKAVFLNHSQSDHTQTPLNEYDAKQLDQLMNHNLNHKRNIISQLQWNKRVDLCLLDAFNFFDITLCNKMFNIPVVIHMFPAVVSKAEYYALRNTFVYLCDPFSLNLYWNMINATVMSYKQKWINVITNAVYLLNQKITSTQILVPILHEFNMILSALNINTLFVVSDYKNGFADFWDQSVIITSLAPPFAPILYTTARIKQFGFLLYNHADDIAIDKDLMQWMQASEVLLISMGSVHVLSEDIMQIMYTQLMEHSAKNNYRVLWALRQNIYPNISNDVLQNENFKIMKSVQQLQVLKHENVKLFMTHCGVSGIMEALYSKTLMVLYPLIADQHMNAQRVEELGVGLMVRDREYMTDLNAIIEELLVNKMQSNAYQYEMDKIHKMISYHGDTSDALQFIQYIIDFGTEHLRCTYNHGYKCNDTQIPWYQQTVFDVYFIIVAIVLYLTVFLKYFCCDCLFQCKRKREHHKQD